MPTATTKKKPSKKAPSSGSDPKSKQIVKRKVAAVMHEFKHGELESGKSSEKVRNPKQAIAIALSEARRAGAKIPRAPAKKKAVKKAAAKKTAAKKKATKKTAAKAKR